MDNGHIEFFKGERHQDDVVGTGPNGQADVHNVCVGMSHKLGNISDSHCVALTSVPSLITTQCLNFEAFFETLKHFCRHLLNVNPSMVMPGGTSTLQYPPSQF